MSLSKCIVRIVLADEGTVYFVSWTSNGFRWTNSKDAATEVSYESFFNIKERLEEYEDVEYVNYDYI